MVSFDEMSDGSRSHNDKDIPELLKTLFTCRAMRRITTNLFLDT